MFAVLLVAATAGSGGASTPPRVSVISDSVLTSVTWGNDAAQAALSQGLDLEIDAGVCRRLNGQSCEFDNGYVPTVLDVINGWSNLGSVVVVVDGYNDLPAAFPGDVELVLDTLRSRGVQHVLWVNLHTVRPEYAHKNAVLAAAARRHPELTLLDWNAYSAAHPDWYQTDGIHLVPAGGIAIAAWLNHAIFAALAAPAATRAPVLAARRGQSVVVRAGSRVDRRLRAVGGVAPLHWLSTGRILHRMQLHLLASGELRGRPTRPGSYRVPVEVVDAVGTHVQVTVRITIRRR